MTGGTLAWGIAFAALCVITGILIGWPIGHARGLRHAAEDARDAATALTIASWKGLTDDDAPPAPPWPDAPPREAPRDGPGKHRHPAGPPRHAELPAAGYLPAPGPWDGTITVPAPAQLPPWETRPASMLQPVSLSSDDGLEPEPQAEVLEPTAVLPPPAPDPRTDTQWTREMAADMDRWIAEHITATDPVLKEITK